MRLPFPLRIISRNAQVVSTTYAYPLQAVKLLNCLINRIRLLLLHEVELFTLEVIPPFSSVPEWDSDVGDDGELVYIKLTKSDDLPLDPSAPLLENCEAFKLRNNFKRSSVRRSTKGRSYTYIHWSDFNFYLQI